MLNVNKANKPPVRLPVLQSLPTDELIGQILRTLQQNPGALVILPWTPPGENKTMCLAVNQQAASRDLTKKGGSGAAGEPEWKLFRGGEPQGAPIWNHTTGDTNLILNLLLAEITFTGLEFQSMKPGPQKYGSAASAPSAGFSQNSNQFQSPFQQPQQAQFQDPSAGGPAGAMGVNLSGNLTDVDLTSVLQSISLCKMAGMLEVNDALKATEMYFDEGVLLHATMQDSVLTEGEKRKGDIVLLELLTWEKGSFKFHANLKSNERSVNRRLEGILMEGAALRDYSKSLNNMGFTTEVTLVKVNPNLGEAQFEQAVRQGVPIDVEQQKAFYIQIGSGSSVDQILARLPMPMTIWLPIVFNLVNCKILKMEGARPEQFPKGTSGMQIDSQALELAYHDMLRPETGLLPYPLFLFFLTQEFHRYRKTGMPFSVAVFELKSRRNNNLELLSNTALKQLAAHMEANLRDELVFISHFQTMDFAMLLPCANSTEAMNMAQKFYYLLQNLVLDGLTSSNDLHFAIGTASLPEHCQDIQSLLNMAIQRKQRITG